MVIRAGKPLPYDLVVVGGGSAGIAAARAAGPLGARTLLVESHRLGGDCLWTGCVPRAVLRRAAAEVHAARQAGRYGLGVPPGTVDLVALMEMVRQASARLEPRDSAEALYPLGTGLYPFGGVGVAYGAARFTGPRTVAVGEREIPFRYALIATGSAPEVPPVPGLSEAAPLTGETVWGLQELPERLVVLGGGSTGCELGQAFARLGSRVAVVEASDRLLPGEDPRVGDLLKQRLEDEGVRVRPGFRVQRVADGAVHGPEGTVPYDRLLVAGPRRPSTSGLGLDAAGVAVDEQGHVRVDHRLRTSNRRVYAAGSVTGACPAEPPGPCRTHVARAQAASAVADALLGVRGRIDEGVVPWVTFTDPEVARVGLTEEQARTRYGDRALVRLVDHGSVDRAVADDRTDGFTCLVLGPRGRIAGATVVAPHAGETIAQLATAVRLRRPLSQLTATVQAYPTYAQGPADAALAAIHTAPGHPRIRGVLLGIRRRLLR